MNCRKFRRLVDDVAAGRADPSHDMAVRAHASVCRACARELGRSEALAAAMARSRVGVSAPAGLTAAVRRRIVEERGQRGALAAASAFVASPMARGLALGAAACALAAVLTWPLVRWSAERGTSPTIVATQPQPAQPSAPKTQVIEHAVRWNDNSDYFADGAVTEFARAEESERLTAGLGL